MLLTQFTDHLTQPQVSNDQFFKELSEKLSGTMGSMKEQDTTLMKERPRYMTIRFVEQLLNKTMWYPQHHEGIWQSVLNMAHSIHLLCANGIVNHIDDKEDMLSHLFHNFASP